MKKETVRIKFLDSRYPNKYKIVTHKNGYALMEGENILQTADLNEYKELEEEMDRLIEIDKEEQRKEKPIYLIILERKWKKYGPSAKEETHAWDIEEARRVSKSLREADGLSFVIVRSYNNHWKEVY